MAQVSLHHGHLHGAFPADPLDIRPAASTSPVAGRPSELNQDFVFPFETSESGSSDQSENADASGRRPRHIPDALQSFDFHLPMGDKSSGDFSSPHLSPASPRSFPLRAGGHRRRGSEFIGGDGREGGSGLMSTSPTKSEGTLPSPKPDAPGRSTGRRGHAHRRSGAISCHDLSMILKPNVPLPSPRAGSAPTSPANVDSTRSFMPSIDAGVQGQGQPMSGSTESQRTPASTDATATTRARVGFSDVLEFIPRPLSTLSSDTSSSLNTVRGSHSVSGSLSSISSLSTWNTSREHRRSSGSNDLGDSMPPRPSTAGAIMGGLENERVPADDGSDGSIKRPLSADAATHLNRPSGTVEFDGEWTSSSDSQGQLGGKAESHPEHRSCSPAGLSSSRSVAPTGPAAPRPIPTKTGLSVNNPPAKTERKAERKTGKKQRRVKSWAGSILSRRSRQRGQKQRAPLRRTPTPPLRCLTSTQPHHSPVASGLAVQTSFPAEQAPPDSFIRSSAAQTYTDWTPRQTAKLQDGDAMSPVIDLDAALGPFNTPSLGPEFGDASSGGFSAARRRMHSSGIMSGFSGPGMHYHRRTESAPEMAAFEFGHFGIHRLGSSSTMADVFEEDEDEVEAEKQTSRSHRGLDELRAAEDGEEEGLGVGIAVVEAEDSQTGPAINWTFDDSETVLRGVKRKGSGLSEGDRRQLTPVEQHVPGPIEEVARAEGPSGDASAREDSTSAASATRSLDATATAPGVDAYKERPAPIEVNLATPNRPYLTPDLSSAMTTSTFPSPDYQMYSFDFPRSDTAASSFTDEHTLDSLLMGEPGPEVRMSVDDVPSLTSSNSTMTSGLGIGMGHHGGVPPGSRGSTAQAERSSSISSSVLGKPHQSFSSATTTKRSSIVSLSRLVGGSHSEKSKLSIEERAQPDSPEKGSKDKKGKRLSRMMHWLKPKESS
ncbi:MAG: hypothetical protein M1825_002223 [Sarcosagium campestre]|nr:MAG: hypothetical protein M1825_002223 [Sarcosagium campestre]